MGVVFEWIAVLSRKRRFAFLPGAVVVCAMVLGGVAMHLGAQRADRDLERELHDCVSGMRRAFLEWGESLIVQAEIVASESAFRQAAQKLMRMPGERRVLVMSLALGEWRTEIDPLVSLSGAEVSLVSPDGVVMADSLWERLGEMSPRTVREDLLPGVLAGRSEVLVAARDGLFVATPVIGPNDNILGALVLCFETRDLVRLPLAGEGVRGFVVDEDGTVLDEAPAPANGDTAKSWRKNLPQVVELVISGTSGVDVDGYLDNRGVRVTGAWTWDERWGLGFVYEMEAKRAFAAYSIFQWLGIGLLACLALLFLLFAWALARSGKQSEASAQRLRNELEARRQRGRHYHDLFDSTPDPMLIVDSNGLVMEVNKQVEHMFGYPPDEILGLELETLIPGGVLEDRLRNREHYLEKPGLNPMGSDLEATAVRADGRAFPAEIALSPAKVQGGVAVIVVVRDVTRRKQVEEELNRHQERLEEQVRERTVELRQEIEARAEAEEVLRGKMDEMERFGRIATKRELRMIALKREINELLKRMGQEPRYTIVK